MLDQENGFVKTLIVYCMGKEARAYETQEWKAKLPVDPPKT